MSFVLPWTWEDPRAVLSRHGLRAKRSFSQNFLTAKGIVQKIAEAAEATPSDRVVELGPGLGTLTTALLATGAEVIAIDQDRDMLGVLRAELGSVPRLRIEEGDATQVNLSALAEEHGGPVVVAGNLPYAATGAILRRLVIEKRSMTRAIVMVQREVADRLVAAPGSGTYGALSVFTHAQMAARKLFAVPPGAFHPPPKVTSAVVSLTPFPIPRAEETDAFRSVVRAAFEQRRKVLTNALSSAFARADVVRALRVAGVDGDRRGETLSVEEFSAIARALAP